MTFTKKLFFAFVFTISFALLYLWFVQGESRTDSSLVNIDRYTNRKDVVTSSSIRRSQKNLQPVIDAGQHRMDLDNSKAIDDIIKLEQIELNKRGVYIDINKYKLRHKQLSTSNNEHVEDNSKYLQGHEEDKMTVYSSSPGGAEKHLSVENMVSRQYKYRNPAESDLQKLSTAQLDIERATDPLSISAKCPHEVFLLVLIISHPRNADRRKYIRDSWALSYADDIHKLKSGMKLFPHGLKFELKNIFKAVFVVGQAKGDDVVMKKVLEEAQYNKDIVFGSLQEDYRNLTMKTRLGLKWAYYECKSVHVVKTDDDVFVNPVPLVEWLKGMPLEKLYTGFCNFNSPVVRNKANKWYVSPEDFSGTNYPGYCLGGGYLMSEDVLGRFLKLSYGQKLFPMEDLYVGLIIKQLGDVHVNDKRKHFDLLYNGRRDVCDMNDLFLAHQVFAQDLIKHIQLARKALESC